MAVECSANEPNRCSARPVIPEAFDAPVQPSSASHCLPQTYHLSRLVAYDPALERHVVCVFRDGEPASAGGGG